jgi:hypothetical protein
MKKAGNYKKKQYKIIIDKKQETMNIEALRYINGE